MPNSERKHLIDFSERVTEDEAIERTEIIIASARLNTLFDLVKSNPPIEHNNEGEWLLKKIKVSMGANHEIGKPYFIGEATWLLILKEGA